MTEQQQYTPQHPNPRVPKALQVLAKIITYIFHPVFVPAAVAFILMKLVPDSFNAVSPKMQGQWILSTIITTLFFPVFSIALMKPLGFINSYHMPTARERIIPLMTSMIFYFWINHVFNNLPAVPFIYKSFFLGNFLCIIAVFMFNIFTKVSIHTSGAGSVVGVMGVLLLMGTPGMATPVGITLAIAAIVGLARYALSAHSKGQIFLGYALGILCQLFAYWYSK